MCAGTPATRGQVLTQGNVIRRLEGLGSLGDLVNGVGESVRTEGRPPFSLFFGIPRL